MKNRGLTLLLACSSALSWAGTTSSGFFVRMELRLDGKCVSQTLSDETGGLVQVVCGSGTFVSIEPRPGKPFVGTHGGVYRFFFAPDLGAVNSEFVLAGGPFADLHAGFGTVTGMRVYDASGDGGAEVLISY